VSGENDNQVGGEDNSFYPPAPLPPHERHWRHPAELGAAQTVNIPLAGSRSKSIAFVVALASMVTTVVFAQILRPVERGRDNATPTASSESTIPLGPPPTKGVFVVNGTPYAAVAVAVGNGRRILITSSDAATDTLVKLADSKARMMLAAVDEEYGLAIWSSPTRVETVASDQQFEVVANDRVIVWDGVTYRGSVGLASRATTTSSQPLVPLNISDKVHAGSPVYDTEGHLIGIVTIRSHSHWMIPITQLGVSVETVARILDILDTLGFAPVSHADGVKVGYAPNTTLFERGDVITHVGDKQITSVQTLTTAAATIAGGKAVFSVIRDGKTIQVNVELPAK